MHVGNAVKGTLSSIDNTVHTETSISSRFFTMTELYPFTKKAKTHNLYYQGDQSSLQKTSITSRSDIVRHVVTRSIMVAKGVVHFTAGA